MSGPLDGVRVLEVSQILAAPYGGMLLADLGADVVKLEAPGGDGMRLIGMVAPGESKLFHGVNRGKRGIVLDLQKPEAQQLVHRIIPRFDVFVINSRPGVSARLHVDYETLSALHPELVYVDSTGYGTRGPSAMRAGSDIVMQAYSGLLGSDHKVNEFGEPESMAIAIGDMGTGLAMAIGVCAALYRRALGGGGEFIETSLLNTALSLQSMSTLQMPVSDEMLVRPMLDELETVRRNGGTYEELIEAHQGTRAASGAFAMYYGGYQVQDGALILGALTPANQQQMREVLGVEGEDPSQDPDFNALDPEDAARVEAFHARLREIMRSKTAAEWIALFDAKGAPVSRVNFPEEMAHDPQVEAMGYMLDVDHELTGPELAVGPIMSMRHHPVGTDRPSPPLGQHTNEVLTELGLSTEELATARAAGAFG